MIFEFIKCIEENTESEQIFFFDTEILRIGISKYHIYIELQNKNPFIGKIVKNHKFLTKYLHKIK